ncbi:hypothetical protein Lal_00018479 [Lupinus albus]|nr:hypothetical protein Lal_00018479 [Lupinus albus]
MDLSDDDNQGCMGDHHDTTQGEPSGSAPQNSAFGLDQLEAMEQRLNNRMDLHFQGLKDSYFAETLFGKLQEHEMELGRLTLHEESDKRKKGISLKASTSQDQEDKDDDESDSEIDA